MLVILVRKLFPVLFMTFCTVSTFYFLAVFIQFLLFLQDFGYPGFLLKCNISWVVGSEGAIFVSYFICFPDVDN